MNVFPSAAPLRLFVRLLLILLVCGGVGMHSLRAELTAEQKKALFRKSHQSSSGSATKSSSGRSSAKKKSSSSSGNRSSGTYSSKKRSATSGSRAAASTKGSSSQISTGKNSAGKSSPRKNSSPSSAPHVANSSGGSRDASSSESSKPASSPGYPAPTPNTANTPATALPPSLPLPLPLPHGATPSAPITIEKSGVEADQGLEPAPTPPPAPEGFWSRLFGSRKSYTYLSSSTRAAIDRAPVRRGRWKYIVIHNSGTREGNARVFDIYHRRVRHMQNGLAYHFVIGDGHGSGDGQVEVGPRWTRQINGGHVASDYLNDIALGICLVGDFNRDTPTKAQVGAIEELVSYLRNRVGKSQGRQAIVHAHKEINPRPTDCPGDHFPYGWLHAKFGNAR